ncbi:MAG: 50S ribosomal protein L24 [Patescibacteria group bacterium]|nr:50S ribosomal protein L24 [Patescibacteria group bacterium]MDD4304619.1 50S ribosomal protein L24 [Patescibacteria group bacterium]MDD4695546.1 50S ribosomal protein L24 [Patescibacteria group bacterium]
MKIKKNDTVKVIVGKDKGKTGKVTQIFSKLDKVVVEGVNKSFKNLKPKKRGESGQRIEFDFPLNISNVVLICKKCGKTTRVAYKVSENNKYRICKKCKEIID